MHTNVVGLKQFFSGCSPDAYTLFLRRKEDAILTIDQVPGQAMQLPYEDKQAVVEILRKRLIDEERDRIALAAKDALSGYASDKVTRGTAKDLQAYLDTEDE